LLVVPSRLCKWYINIFTSPNPVYSHIIHDNIYMYIVYNFSCSNGGNEVSKEIIRSSVGFGVGV
jgi:hypothetical protein